MALLSWGNYPNIDVIAYKFENRQALKNIINQHNNIIASGNGRSYGDSALNKHQIDVKSYNYFLDFDQNTGILHCQAGVLLSEILETFIPKGWFVSVTPGTKLITVGGAIASDVHGKNHHVKGSFSDSIVEFTMMLENGEIIICSHSINPDIFQATCGGMGLTGIIIDAKIKFLPINSSMIDQLTIKTKNLQDTFEAFEQYKDYTYSVAWIDCMAKGDSLGRCLLMVGEHADDGNLDYVNTNKISIPFQFPSFVLNNLTVKSFNSLYYAKVRQAVSQQKIGIDSFFYPLDAIGNWNRIYGKNGFTQYQFVLPLEKSYEGLEQILSKIAASGKGSFLAVLKLFGKANANWLSFPIQGYTLALDFKIEPGLFELLNELDKIVLKYEGRFYLSKDVRVSKQTFEAGYKDIDKFRQLRKQYKMDQKFHSLQSKRVGI
ncbi:FAD-binding oxidoreductase [Candidatus Marithrix sp. Canyon 246]|uniref:FAD-binding oxidoreductase n=1 Tax=Candidatus Marithrix sp. Canyon 246 TaxID=1827136 RepID=UPI00084A0C8C|nr:FAD-binding oxidoreductase [Candidatus Marithrix sp. Canyon 246]